MFAAPNSSVPAAWTPMRVRRYALAFFSGTLATTVVLKVGEIQYLELIFAADLLLLMWLFFAQGLRVQFFRPFFTLARSYAVFLVLALILSFAALNQNFAAYNFTLFKRPIIVTLARMAELVLDLVYMFYLAGLYREDEQFCAFGARVYYWTAIVSGLYSILCIPFNIFLDMQLGTYGIDHRFRGFDNEGGSYGPYVISAFILGVAMYHRGWLSRRYFYTCQALLIVCLLGSQSKSAFFAVAILGVLHLAWSVHGRRRWLAIATLCAALVLLGSVLDIADRIDVYVKDSATYQTASLLRSNDGNFVLGRVAGAVLAPRMIAAHPLIGIGWGNYPLVRDNPEYRQGSAFSIASTDAPGLGAIDYMVDLGLPLWLYLVWIQIKPAWLLRRHGADPWLLSLAMVLPVVNWFGAHLNLTYPWIVLGLALAMGFRKHREPPPQVSFKTLALQNLRGI